MKNSRKTICLLIEGLGGLYYSQIWPGISDGARSYDANLICYEGGTLRISPWNPYEFQSNMIYNHIPVENIDGLIISGTLKNFISDREFSLFLERFNRIPIVTLAPTLEDIPAVLIDNSSGVRSVISHLVTVHGHNRFAFIGGPQGNVDASQRQELFQKIMFEYGLEGGSDRVIAEDFSREGGGRAAKKFLQRGISFDALIAVNDESALGAIAALQESGIRVPEDVAVAGFDGIEEGELTTPPLTTVRQPFYEIGKSAVDILTTLIEGGSVPMRTVLDAPLVIRQSCGCFINPQHSLNIIHSDLPDPVGIETHEEKCEWLINSLKMFEPLIEEKIGSGDELKRLVEAFIDEVENDSDGVFLPALNRVVRTIVLAGEDALQWQKILAAMRRFVGTLVGDKLKRADLLLHDAYNLFSEAAVRVQTHKRLIEEQQAALLRSAGQAIANSFDIPTLSKAIEREFPKIGIDEFYLSLYDKNSENFNTSNTIFALKDGKKSPLPKNISFSSRELLPGGLKKLSAPWQLVIQPLYFKHEQLGFALFRSTCCKGFVFHILSQHLCGALQGALLMKKVQEQAITLEQTNQQLQKLREQEHAYLEAIKRELELGRKIQSSFLPDSLPQIKGWQSKALFLPAREVSGDFYDAFMLKDGRAAYVIADVSGKDVSAALFMSLIRTLIRAFTEQSAESIKDPLSAVDFANKYIALHHHTGTGRFMYATMFFAVVDPKTGEVIYINAGHNPPALLRANGEIKKWLDPTGPAVGISDELDFNQEKLTLNHGEMILLYTDGVIEARNANGEFFTKTKFSKLINRPYASACEIIEKVEETLSEHSEGTVPYDDITMLALRREKQ
ncbi:SpoIIE family protein phosphatase [Chitinispirillales bacterium ANBcel5]|uniref:SpoIIE family protein phosphatase n=1 Tax=Cellulosispirillum alkaliphilum TaxID=3039283 RepID=UPI002A50F364|nr:SpoIIE family protein phosphatase [Chitinispirillales bacterium ANBcel5]